MYEVIYLRQAAKALRKVPEPQRTRIISAIETLPKGNGHIKRLNGEPGYRMRVGEWRVIYDIDQGRLIINVIRIGPRGGIYKH